MIPKVSVLTTTYNHEKYIAQAVNSVISQKTNFHFEMVIGEDCSTDRTKEILSELYAQHPNIIHLLLREENIGRRQNFLSTFRTCRGEYIAILEGDDYWSSPDKLQMQADFLDDHPECAICFHPVMMAYEDSNRQPRLYHPPFIKEIYTLEDLLERNFIATCAVMFRKGLITEFPDWFYHIPAADWPLNVLNAQHGHIGYLPQPMGVYRVHGSGIWASLAEINKLQKNLEVKETVRDALGPQYENIIARSISRTHLRMVRAMVRNRDFLGAGRHTLRLLFGRRVSIQALFAAGWRSLLNRFRKHTSATHHHT